MCLKLLGRVEFFSGRPQMRQQNNYGYGSSVTSNSVLHSLGECQYKYKVKYERRGRTVCESSYFTIGKIIHDLVDKFYKSPIHKVTSSAQLNWLLSEHKQLWIERFDSELLSSVLRFQRLYSDAIEDTQKHGPYVKPTTTKYWKTKHGPTIQTVLRAGIMPQQLRFPDVIWRKDPLELYTLAEKCLANFVKMHQENNEYDRIESEWKIPPIELHSQIFTEIEDTEREQYKSGIVDRVEFRGDKVKVIDYKTGSKKWSLNRIVNSDQLCWYAVAVEHHFGIQPETIGIWDLNNGQITEYELTQDDIDRFLLRMQVNVNAVRAFNKMQAVAQEYNIEDALFIPAGVSYGGPCPCDLVFENDPEIKCKYYRDIEYELKLKELEYEPVRKSNDAA